MKEKIKKCTVAYESWQMQCCGDPIEVGKAADLQCFKQKRYKSVVGIDIDYDENHHWGDINCILRGVVTRIQSVFVDKFARIEGNTYYVDDPNNEFAVIDTNYIDGWEECENYAHRNANDVSFYIITLEDVVKREYDNSFDDNQGKYIVIEPGDEGKELFWANDGKLIGDTDVLSYFDGKTKKIIDFTSELWHDELVEWKKEFLEHFTAKSDNWTNDDWLDWWCRGYGFAKRVRKLLPPDIFLSYGERWQCVEVIIETNNKYLNPEGRRIYLPSDMGIKADAGLFIPKVSLDSSFQQKKSNDYRFLVHNSVHHLFPEDRVVLSVSGHDTYQLGTILQVNEDSLTIHTDRRLVNGEEYSIELII